MSEEKINEKKEFCLPRLLTDAKNIMIKGIKIVSVVGVYLLYSSGFYKYVFPILGWRGDYCGTVTESQSCSLFEGAMLATIPGFVSIILIIILGMVIPETIDDFKKRYWITEKECYDDK